MLSPELAGRWLASGDAFGASGERAGAGVGAGLCGAAGASQSAACFYGSCGYCGVAAFARAGLGWVLGGVLPGCGYGVFAAVVGDGKVLFDPGG